jgi:hypothetical protein
MPKSKNKPISSIFLPIHISVQFNFKSVTQGFKQKILHLFQFIRDQSINK